MKVQKQFPIHWQNGMKLSKELFAQQYNAVQQNLQHTISCALHPYAYGLCGGMGSFDVTISYDQQNMLLIRIQKLMAVTLDGTLIDIQSSYYHTQDHDGFYTFNVPIGTLVGAHNYWICLRVLENEHLAIHTPLSYQSMDQQILAAPKMEVQLIQLEDLVGGQLPAKAFVIGSCSISGSKVTILDHFIPAMMWVNQQEDMQEWYHAVLQVLEQSLNRSVNLVSKIRQRNQQNELSQLVQQLCLHIIASLQVQLPSLRMTKGNIPPHRVFESLGSIAMVVKNSLDMNTGAGKEELMNYLSEWMTVSPALWDDMCNRTVHLQLNTIDHNENIAAVNQFMTTFHSLLETLDKLDFIGKRKDTGLFIKEENNSRVNQPEETPKAKRRFFGYS